MEIVINNDGVCTVKTLNEMLLPYCPRLICLKSTNLVFSSLLTFDPSGLRSKWLFFFSFIFGTMDYISTVLMTMRSL